MSDKRQIILDVCNEMKLKDIIIRFFDYDEKPYIGIEFDSGRAFCYIRISDKLSSDIDFRAYVKRELSNFFPK
jgi:hypothetical protein